LPAMDFVFIGLLNVIATPYRAAALLPFSGEVDWTRGGPSVMNVLDRPTRVSPPATLRNAVATSRRYVVARDSVTEGVKVATVSFSDHANAPGTVFPSGLFTWTPRATLALSIGRLNRSTTCWRRLAYWVWSSGYTLVSAGLYVVNGCARPASGAAATLSVYCVPRRSPGKRGWNSSVRSPTQA